MLMWFHTRNVANISYYKYLQLQLKNNIRIICTDVLFLNFEVLFAPPQFFFQNNAEVSLG